MEGVLSVAKNTPTAIVGSVNSETPNGVFLELYSSVTNAIPTENI